MNIKEFLFEDKKLIKRIFKIAIPSLFDLLAQTLIATSDMIMVSSIGASAISSVGVGTAAFNAIIPALIAVAIGTTAILSRAYGAKNREEGQKALIQSYFIAIPIGIILMLSFFFFAKPIIEIVGNAKDLNLEDAIIYQKTTAIGFVFLSIGITTFFFRALGKNKIPMIGNTMVLIVNIIFNYLFIYILKWGVFGAALATSIARGSVVIMCIYLIFVNKRQWISLNIKKMKFDYFTAKRIIKVGIPAAIEQLALRFGMLIFEIMVISLGNLNYAAHKIALTAESFSFNLGFAVSLAATALVGQELGKNSPKNALKNGYLCTLIGLIIMSTMGLLFFIAPNLLISLFTDDPQVISLSTMALRLVSICQPFLAISMILSGALRGAGATRSVLFITFFGIFLVRIPITYVFLYIFNMGLAGAWIVMTIDLIFRSSLCFYTFKKGKWKYLKV